MTGSETLTSILKVKCLLTLNYIAYNLRGPKTDIVESWTIFLKNATNSFSMVEE